jgi:hypothetical protein
MAKLSFTKLGLKANQDIQQVEYNGQIIEVKQYLPVNDKLGLISDVINAAADGNFANPIKIDIYTAIYVIETYTNINFTDKQKEDICKIYDLFVDNGLLKAIIEAIPKEEYGSLVNGIYRSVNAVYEYKNSILCILEAVSADYSALDYEATDIQKKLNDPQNMELLRGILSKLG